MLARVRAGDNPADDIRKEKTAPTVAMLAEEYLRRCDPYWKPSGRRTVRIYLKARILPAFGKMQVERVGPEVVAAWFDEASRDRPGAANRAFEILRSMMFRAEEYGFREPGTNPCLGIRKNPRRNIARFLDTDELARLGRALDGFRVAADVLVYSRDEVEYWRDSLNHVLARALREGRVLYERR